MNNLQDEDSLSEFEYLIKNELNYLRHKSRQLREIQQHAANIKESALFNLCNIRLNDIQDEIEVKETRLDLEQRKAKSGFTCIHGTKKSHPMFDEKYRY